ERIGQEVEYDLLPHVAVDEDRLRQWGAIHTQSHVRAFDGGTECPRKLGGEFRKVDRLETCLPLASFDAREVKQCVDKLEQANAIAMRHSNQRPVPGRNFARTLGEDLLERTEHQRERRAKLVAYIGEKCCLRAIDFRQRLRSSPLLLVCLCVGDRRSDLNYDQVEKTAVVLVKQPKRVESAHQKAGAARFTARGYWQHHGVARRPRPRTGREICAERFRELDHKPW